MKLLPASLAANLSPAEKADKMLKLANQNEEGCISRDLLKELILKMFDLQELCIEDKLCFAFPFFDLSQTFLLIASISPIGV